MAERARSAKGSSPMKPARSTATSKKKAGGLTADERAAMKDRLQELKAERSGKVDGEGSVRAKIAEMPQPDRAMCERLHEIIKASAPVLVPRLWYGMPAYAKDGKVLCFFQSAQKFKTRYSTFGFMDVATLDEGNLWPVSFAIKKLAAADEAAIKAMLRRAVS